MTTLQSCQLLSPLQQIIFSSAVLAVPLERLYILIELNVKDTTFFNIGLSIYIEIDLGVKNSKTV